MSPCLNTGVFRSMREELTSMQNKETEVSHKKADVEKQLEVVESEKVALRQQLKLAQTRIESLQAALKGEDSEEEEEMTSFLDHHRRAMSVQRDRRSMTRELRSDTNKYFLYTVNIFGKSWIRGIFGRIMKHYFAAWVGSSDLRA